MGRVNSHDDPPWPLPKNANSIKDGLVVKYDLRNHSFMFVSCSVFFRINFPETEPKNQETEQIIKKLRF